MGEDPDLKLAEAGFGGNEPPSTHPPLVPPTQHIGAEEHAHAQAPMCVYNKREERGSGG